MTIKMKTDVAPHHGDIFILVLTLTQHGPVVLFVRICGVAEP